MLHDLKEQNASLRADFAKTPDDQRARLQDFERRLTLAEARHAASTAAAAAPQAAPALPPPAAVPLARPVSLVRASAALPVRRPAEAKRYRVQAASPGLALLAEIDRGGGEGAQLQVVVGDSIPWLRPREIHRAAGDSSGS